MDILSFHVREPVLGLGEATGHYQIGWGHRRDRGYLRVGRQLDETGNAGAGWSEPVELDGSWSPASQFGGVSAYDLGDDGRAEEKPTRGEWALASVDTRAAPQRHIDTATPDPGPRNDRSTVALAGETIDHASSITHTTRSFRARRDRLLRALPRAR